QAVAQKAQASALQTIKSVRQLRDSTSEFERVNDATINALSIKDKNDKIVTATRNFAHINNDKLKPILLI
ncbi:719_t:CDS:2, partial [Cetraspora pellucida]